MSVNTNTTYQVSARTPVEGVSSQAPQRKQAAQKKISGRQTRQIDRSSPSLLTCTRVAVTIAMIAWLALNLFPMHKSKI